MGEDTEKLGGYPLTLGNPHSIYLLCYAAAILAHYLYYFLSKEKSFVSSTKLGLYQGQSLLL